MKWKFSIVSASQFFFHVRIQFCSSGNKICVGNRIPFNTNIDQIRYKLYNFHHIHFNWTRLNDCMLHMLYCGYDILQRLSWPRFYDSVYGRYPGRRAFRSVWKKEEFFELVSQLKTLDWILSMNEVDYHWYLHLNASFTFYFSLIFAQKGSRHLMKEVEIIFLLSRPPPGNMEENLTKLNPL